MQRRGRPWKVGVTSREINETEEFIPLLHDGVISAYDSVVKQWYKLIKVPTEARQRNR